MREAKPSILLAEDDPIAREVVKSHLLALGCQVRGTASATEAIALCVAARFDALVLDCQLNGGDAQMVIDAVRVSGHGANTETPAIAMSAELDDARFDALIAAGFADAMEKPIHRSRLRHALSLCGIDGLAEVRAHVATVDAGEQLILDDAAGLRACGNSDVLTGLRRLLALELGSYRAEIDACIARVDADALRDCIHRMKSALGFCGAMELLFLLEQAGPTLPDAEALHAWGQGMDHLAAALAAQR